MGVHRVGPNRRQGIASKKRVSQQPRALRFDQKAGMTIPCYSHLSFLLIHPNF
jgi:hypothetical protein